MCQFILILIVLQSRAPVWSPSLAIRADWFQPFVSGRLDGWCPWNWISWNFSSWCWRGMGLLLYLFYHKIWFELNFCCSFGLQEDCQASAASEDIVLRERQRLEEFLRSKGMQPGSYPPFVAAVKGQKVLTLVLCFFFPIFICFNVLCSYLIVSVLLSVQAFTFYQLLSFPVNRWFACWWDFTKQLKCLCSI